jgi:hypothetical protein
VGSGLDRFFRGWQQLHENQRVANSTRTGSMMDNPGGHAGCGHTGGWCACAGRTDQQWRSRGRTRNSEMVLRDAGMMETDPECFRHSRWMNPSRNQCGHV